MSCGTCGIQAGNTMQGDTGVPPGAPTTAARARCPYCQAFIALVGAACTNPRCPCNVAEQALAVARVTGPTAETRALACRHPRCAVLYALEVDQAPRDDTRQAACQDAYSAFRYAHEIDQTPRDDTRQAACRMPHAAFQYARDVDGRPRDDTRQAACRHSGDAYLYARDVDQSPRTDTRTAACQHPDSALAYAQDVDQAPRDDTRAAACKTPASACNYARDIDQAPRADTRQACLPSPYWAYEYARQVDQSPRADTRAAAGQDGPHAAAYAEWEQAWRTIATARTLLTTAPVLQALESADEYALCSGPQGQVEFIYRIGWDLHTCTLDPKNHQASTELTARYGAALGPGADQEWTSRAATAFRDLLHTRLNSGWQPHCLDCGHPCPAGLAHKCTDRLPLPPFLARQAQG